MTTSDRRTTVWPPDTNLTRAVAILISSLFVISLTPILSASASETATSPRDKGDTTEHQEEPGVHGHAQTDFHKKHDALGGVGKKHQEHRKASSDHDDHEEDSGDHRDHDEDNQGHDDHDEERRIQLKPRAIQQAGIITTPCGPGIVRRILVLPGEVTLNADQVTHVVPRIGGIVSAVDKSLGDMVKTGDILATIESRELADAKSAFLEAQSRLDLARSNFEREESLWKRKISAEKDYFEARQSIAEARITLRTTQEKLLALGLDERQVKALNRQAPHELTRLPIVAPFDGTIIEKHIALGEVIDSSSDIFVIANLSTVWIEITIYARDLGQVAKGQTVRLSAEGVPGEATGAIDLIAPVIDEKTRTGRARVTLANPDGLWRPGLFLTARIELGGETAAVTVPRGAVQRHEGKTVVFVNKGGGQFEVRSVTLGQFDSQRYQVTSGLIAGERVVTAQSFTLLAELGKSSAGHDH